jgi:hypothetical protein
MVDRSRSRWFMDATATRRTTTARRKWTQLMY